MKRLLQKFVAAIILMTLLLGCASTGAVPGSNSGISDTTKTKMEGAGVGGLLLGVTGAIIGYQKNGIEGAIIGGLAGLTAGAALGYVAGSSVATRKEQYASDEDRLDGEIEVVAGYNEQLQKINQQTVARIQALDEEILTLRTQYQNGTAEVAALTKKQEEIRVLIETNEKTKESMTSEMISLNEYQKNLKTTDQIKLEKLREEITILQENISLLEESSEQMALRIETINVEGAI